MSVLTLKHKILFSLIKTSRTKWEGLATDEKKMLSSYVTTPGLELPHSS